jgi:hypothetical protein
MSRPHTATWPDLVTGEGWRPGPAVRCVPADDSRQEHLCNLYHLPQFDRLEIEHFFLIYKKLRSGRPTWKEYEPLSSGTPA